ncbi:hypothetical protein K440DRAFT_628447, partial [Wilcoxina mikolae CBS 423.85]
MGERRRALVAMLEWLSLPFKAFGSGEVGTRDEIRSVQCHGFSTPFYLSYIPPEDRCSEIAQMQCSRQLNHQRGSITCGCLLPPSHGSGAWNAGVLSFRGMNRLASPSPFETFLRILLPLAAESNFMDPGRWRRFRGPCVCGIEPARARRVGCGRSG